MYMYLALPVGDDLLPKLLLGGEAGAGSHKPAVSQYSLVEVCGTDTVHHQLRVLTYILLREREGRREVYIERGRGKEGEGRRGREGGTEREGGR